MRRTRWHLLFLLAGAATGLFLGIHMAVQHLNQFLGTGESDPTSWASMIGRAADWGWVVIYILLLAFGLFHGLYGLRGIVAEVVKSENKMRLINRIFLVGGLVIFIWASYVPVALATR